MLGESPKQKHIILYFSDKEHKHKTPHNRANQTADTQAFHKGSTTELLTRSSPKTDYFPIYDNNVQRIKYFGPETLDTQSHVTEVVCHIKPGRAA